MWESIRLQTGLGPRRPGSLAGQIQAKNLACELSARGLVNVREEEIPLTHWEPARANLEIDGNPIDCFPIPHAKFTGEGGCEGRIVWAQDSGDWRGAIVAAEIRFPELDAKLLRKISMGEIDREDSLIDVRHPATWVRLGWHFYSKAVSKGAIGFIGIVKDQPGGSCKMYAPYGFREKDILNKPLPGVWVSRSDAKKIRSAARAKILTTGIHEKSRSSNVVGEIPGESEETLLLTCHHDSPFVSPVEDASGIATVLAIAEHFANQKRLKRRLVVLLSAGHFYGSVGTRTFIEKHRKDLLPHIVLALSIEHIAKEAVEDAAGKLVPTGKSEAAGVFLSFNQAIRQALLSEGKKSGVDRWVLLPAEGPLGDYPPTDGGDWYAAGVPIVNYISNPVYLLTDEDAEKWVDEENLPRVAKAFTGFLSAVDTIPRPTLARCDFPVRRFLMKALRLFTWAKSTRWGTAPVH